MANSNNPAWAEYRKWQMLEQAERRECERRYWENYLPGDLPPYNPAIKESGVEISLDLCFYGRQTTNWSIVARAWDNLYVRYHTDPDWKLG